MKTYYKIQYNYIQLPFDNLGNKSWFRKKYFFRLTFQAPTVFWQPPKLKASWYIFPSRHLTKGCEERWRSWKWNRPPHQEKGIQQYVTPSVVPCDLEQAEMMGLRLWKCCVKPGFPYFMFRVEGSVSGVAIHELSEQGPFYIEKHRTFYPVL